MPKSSRRNARILLVEDEFMIASLLQRMLGNHGCGITWVGNVEDGAQLAANEKLDGAVLDINLAGEKVFPVCDVLRARGIPFVFTTAYDTSTVPEKYKGRPVISKPLVKDEISGAVAFLRSGVGAATPVAASEVSGS